MPTLPELPVFTPMHNIQGLHRGYVMLPPDIQLDNNVNILALFKLFFTDEQLQMIVESTNEYEQIKGVEGGRPWYLLTLNELKIWFALVIYMGVHKIYAVEDLWNSNEKRAIHSIKEYMTLLRFQQIKRFLHISKPNEPHLCWYSKVEPLASHIREVSKQLYFPSSQVSVDEMIARFSGRSAHTDMQITPVVGLSKTGGSVWHLVKQLPHHKTFHVYMDNYFSSIPLFKYMRDNGLGACGTVRTNSSKFPKELKINKGISLDWNTISGKVVDDVLAIVWVDNSPVTMLTTIHEIVGEEWKIIRNRRRPRETSSNASTVHRVFGNASRKELSIPKVIDDYNHYMGGVDIADQLRDTVLVNCSLLYNKVVNENVKSKSFRIDLVWGLIKDVMDNDNSISTRSTSTTTCLYDNEESFFPQTKTKSK
ncbi:6526_t:CDS:2, partial [Paraglomus brasilianum]